MWEFDGRHRLRHLRELVGRLRDPGRCFAMAAGLLPLIKKGLGYMPTFGRIAFTVPMVDGFLKRALPE